MRGGSALSSDHQGNTVKQATHQPVKVITVVAIAWLGLWAHELFRVRAMLGLTPDGSLPLLVIAGALILWWLLAAQKRVATIALLVYGLINFAGAVLTVLPLPFLPFVPEQEVDHYLVHGIYAVCQLPLIVVTLAGSRLPVK